MSKLIKLDDKIKPDKIKQLVVDALNDNRIEEFFFFYIDPETEELTTIKRWIDDYQLAGMLNAIAHECLFDIEITEKENL